MDTTPATRTSRWVAGGVAVALLASAALLHSAGFATADPVAWSWTGQLNSATGEAVSPQPCDVNGNGKPDVIASSWTWKRNGQAIGATYVIFDDSVPGELDDSASRVMRIEGPLRANALTGFAVSCAGDVNNDGYEDILITEYTASRVHVVFGGTDRSNLSLEFLGDRGFRVQGGTQFKAANGAITNDRTGFDANGVGDLNGDGLADVGVVSLNSPGGGMVSIVSGQDDIATVDLSYRSDDLAPGVLARIHAHPDRRISHVAPAGDVNGDGVPDLIVGAYTGQPQGSTAASAGVAYVVFGPVAGRIKLEDAHDGKDYGEQKFNGFVINGPERGRDRLGISAVALGDIDGDGHDDIALGADGVNGTAHNGSVVVVRGSASTAPVTTDPEAVNGKSVFAGGEDRGWWVNFPGQMGAFGYRVTARKPAAPGRSATVVTGGSAASSAVAFDTRALTSPVVQFGDMQAPFITQVSGGSRFGRAVSHLPAGFKDSAVPMMVAGGGVQGPGEVRVVPLPADGPVTGGQVPTPTGEIPSPAVTVTQPVPGPTVTATRNVPGPTVTVPGPVTTVTVTRPTRTSSPPVSSADLVYTMPGVRKVNGRMWSTTCEPYSVGRRCRTEIWATTAVREGSRYVMRQGWVFNNLTYIGIPRQTWGINPMATPGQWSRDGRRWRTECGTALTGPNACRSWIWATVVAAQPKKGGGHTFVQRQQWVLNHIVRFP